MYSTYSSIKTGQAFSLVICLQRFRVRVLIAKIQETPPLIQCNFAITVVLIRFEEFAKGVEPMGRDASARETHFEEGDDQVLVESFVRPGSVELEAKLSREGGDSERG